MHSTSSPGPSSNPHAQALQACVREALAEGPALIRRWVQGLMAELRVCESQARNYREKTDILEASKALATHGQQLEQGFVGQWNQAIQNALKGAGKGGARQQRSLSQLRFDELELMDDDQVQATVEVARVQQAVQVASDRALADLSARLSRAQGYGAVRSDQNPLRPEVVIQALGATLESVCRQTGVRSLWLQHGSKALAAELDVLYRHLGRLLDEQGVKPADYVVIQTPANPPSRHTGHGTLPGRRDDAMLAHRGAADPWNDPATGPMVEVTNSSLLTLNHLHRLLVSGHLASAQAQTEDEAPLPGLRFEATRFSDADALPVSGSEHTPLPNLSPQLAAGSAPVDEPLPAVYTGVDRRKRRRDQAPSVAIEQAKADEIGEVAEVVVGMMLDGIARDQRLLPPVRDVLRSLRPLFLRIARDNPRFFADRQNPARRLLDEMTEQSLAFGSVRDRGFPGFLGMLQKVVGLLLQTDGHASSVVAKALHAMQAGTEPEAVEMDRALAQKRAMASLMQAEQRFLLAEKVAQELEARKDYARAPAVMQQFLSGPWAQVIAWARLSANEPEQGDGRQSASVRYTDIVSDLLWSCRVDVASRNRSRLVRVIPVLLRNLREGLQTIEYPQEKSCDFFNQLMALHELGLKAEVPSQSMVLMESLSNERPKSVKPEVELWMRPSESRDTGFLDLPGAEAERPTPDFEDTQPLPPRDLEEPQAPEPDEVPDLGMGSWVDLQQADGQWQRAKLAWASPHGTMYLFTVADGKSMSMTRRSFESLWLRGMVRMVASQSMVDDALDSVMNMAVRNSTDQG